MMLASIAVAGALVGGVSGVGGSYDHCGLVLHHRDYPAHFRGSIGTGNRVLRNVELVSCGPRVPNGRHWVTSDHAHLSCDEPGAEAYGANPHDEPAMIFVRVGRQMISINPWQRIGGDGFYARLEAARNQWLERNGYVGGVRTFTNNPDHHRRHGVATFTGEPAPAAPGVIEPRGIIRLPAEMPRFKPQMDVRGPVIVLPQRRLFANACPTDCAQSVQTFRNPSAKSGEVIKVLTASQRIASAQ